MDRSDNDSRNHDRVGMSLLFNAIAQQSQPQPQSNAHTHTQAPAPALEPPQPQSPQPPPSANPSLQCGICKRTYERPDHLNRHIRSHKNARPFRCTHPQCGKTFNRADLLRRHMAIHERHLSMPPSQRRIIRRAERALAACEACVTTKSRCSNEKPCQRCQKKGLECLPVETARESNGALWPSGSGDFNFTENTTEQMVPNLQQRNHSISAHHGIENNRISMDASAIPSNMLSSGIHDGDLQSRSLSQDGHRFDDSTLLDLLEAPSAMNDVFLLPNGSYFTDQESDLSFWELPWEDFQYPLAAQIPNVENSINAEESSTIQKDPQWNTTRGYAAYRRSPWLWTPAPKDSGLSYQADLTISDETLTDHLTPSSGLDNSYIGTYEYLDSAARDSMFALAVASDTMSSRKAKNTTSRFPPLEVLNHLLQVYFVKATQEVDNWIHAPTFDASESHPHFLLALVSAGSTWICAPAIFKMGLAMQEVARRMIGDHWEGENISTRELELLGAFQLCLDVGLWSGYKRKMEISESFAQPLVTMARRAGMFANPQNQFTLPEEDETGESLEIKWRTWVKLESYKRFAIHQFLHCTQASVAFQISPLILLAEFNFALPQSRDLWLAKSATEWKLKLLQRNTSSKWMKMRITDLLDDYSLLKTLKHEIDVELCCIVLLYSFWGQIWFFRESTKFYFRGLQHGRTTRGLWLNVQQTELSKDVEEFSIEVSQFTQLTPDFQLVKELLLTSLYVSPDELQKFAGKAGEEEATRAAESLKLWAQTEDSRKAVWHAGQTLRAGRLLFPTELRGFYAVALYIASLTIWVYSHLTGIGDPTSLDKSSSQDCSTSYDVVLDGPESRESRMFISFGQGKVGLTAYDANLASSFQSLEDPNVALKIARQIYRSNFPVMKESLPPFLENLSKLMRDLSSRPDRLSRCDSQEPQDGI